MGTRLRPEVATDSTTSTGGAGAVLLVLALATVTTVTLVSMHSWVGQVELVISDDRALLNPLAMMKQLAAINKWTGPQQTQQRVPKRAVLEAQVARQQAARDKVSLVAEAHKEAREGWHAPAPTAAFSDKRVSHYEEQAQTLAVKSKEDIEMALELTIHLVLCAPFALLCCLELARSLQ